MVTVRIIPMNGGKVQFMDEVVVIEVVDGFMVEFEGVRWVVSVDVEKWTLNVEQVK